LVLHPCKTEKQAKENRNRPPRPKKQKWKIITKESSAAKKKQIKTEGGDRGIPAHKAGQKKLKQWVLRGVLSRKKKGIGKKNSKEGGVGVRKYQTWGGLNE